MPLSTTSWGCAFPTRSLRESRSKRWGRSTCRLKAKERKEPLPYSSNEKDRRLPPSPRRTKTTFSGGFLMQKEIHRIFLKSAILSSYVRDIRVRWKKGSGTDPLGWTHFARIQRI